MYLNMCTDMFATRNVKKSVFSVWNRCCFVAIIVTTSNLSTCTLAAVNDVCLGMIRREFCPRFPLTLAIPFTYHPSLHEERMILGTQCPVIKSMEDASSNSVPRVIYQTEMGQISSISLKSQWCSFKIRDVYSLACLQLLLLRRAFEYNLGLAHAVVMISEEHGSALGGVLVLVEVACTTGWAACLSQILIKVWPSGTVLSFGLTVRECDCNQHRNDHMSSRKWWRFQKEYCSFKNKSTFQLICQIVRSFLQLWL